MSRTPNAAGTPRKFHLDRRAHQLIEQGAGNADDLMSTFDVATWLGVSIQFLEIGRHNNYGPVFVRLSPTMIRYKRADVLSWLQERTYQSTAEYAKQRVEA